MTTAITITLQGDGNAISLDDQDYVIDAGAGTGNNINAGDGNDTVLGGQGTASIVLGNGDDVVTVAGDGNYVRLGGGADLVDASAGTGNDIDAGNGNDTVLGGLGTASIMLGDGNDAVTVGGNGNYVAVGNGSDRIDASAGTGNDVNAGDGNDTVLGGLGTASIMLGNGDDAVRVGGNGNYVALGNGNDRVDASGGTGNDINAGSGNDTVLGGAGTASIILGDGNDAVSVGGNGNYVRLGGGNDRVDAGTGTGNDIDAGNGNDTVLGGSGTASIMLGDGHDSVTVGGDGNYVHAGNGSDSVALGGGTGNTVIAGGGADSVTGSGGYDDVSLGNGDNTVSLDGRQNFIALGTGFNQVVAGSGDDTVWLAGGSAVVRLAGEGNVIRYQQPLGGGNVISGLQANDLIELQGMALGTAPADVASVTLLNDSILRISEVNGDTQDIGLTDFGADAVSVSEEADGSGIVIDVHCMLPGTLIRTPAGDVPIERLVAGDAVCVVLPAPDVRMLQWVGHRRARLDRHPDAALIAPVRVAADAFAPGMPARDLLLSPDHAVLVDGGLVAIRQLLNAGSIRQEHGRRSVDYYHLQFERHEVVLAENLPLESLRETQRAGLHDAATTEAVVHLPFGWWDGRADDDAVLAAPLVRDPSAVFPIWLRLARRSTQLGFPASVPTPAFLAEPILHIGGRRIAAVRGSGNRFAFVLPSGARSATVCSGAARPTWLQPWLDDRRLLGVAVKTVSFQTDDGLADLPIDHPSLTDGWWPAEASQTERWRWTNGRAILPIPPDASLAIIGLHGAACLTPGRQADFPISRVPRTLISSA